MIFTKLLKWNYPIKVFGQNDAEKFLKWGIYYTSHQEDDTEYPEMLIHMPLNPVKIKQYSMKSCAIDIFPSKWTVFGSFDNKTWDTLSTIDEYLCTNYYVYHEDNPKLYCNGSETKNYDVNSDSYYHYIRFKLRNNTNYNKDSYTYALYLCGFEIRGSVLFPLRSIFGKPNNIISNSHLFLLLLLS